MQVYSILSFNKDCSKLKIICLYKDFEKTVTSLTKDNIKY